MCQYEYVIDGTDSVWCKFFDTEWLKLVEYREDIKNNCRYGKRHEMNTLKECDLVKNALDSLKGFVTVYENDDENATKFHLLFSHSSTVTPFYTILGIGKDENDFNINDIFTENRNRKFRNTFIDPMNSNIALIAYRCDDPKNSAASKYLVRAFHNENLIKIEACKTVDCNMDELTTYFSRFVNSCGSSKNYCR